MKALFTFLVSLASTSLFAQYLKVDHSKQVFKASFSSDGKYFATASMGGEAKLFDLNSSNFLKSINHQNIVTDLEFNFKNDLIATASWDKTVQILNLKENKNICTIHQDGAIYKIAFSHEDLIASAGQDKVAKVTNARTCEHLFSVEHKDQIVDVKIHPKGEILATASRDKTVKLTSLKTGRSYQSIELSNQLTRIAFSPDGKLLAIADITGEVNLTDLSTLETKKLYRHQISASAWSVQFSPDSSLLASGGSDRRAIVIDLKKNNTFAFPHGSYVLGVSFSPNGKNLVTASRDRTAKVIDLEKMIVVCEIYHDWDIYSAVFSPDGQYIGTASGDKTARITSLEEACF